MCRLHRGWRCRQSRIRASRWPPARPRHPHPLFHAADNGTDLFGGTPTNISCALLKDAKKIEIITGFNLPVLIKALLTREEESDLASLASIASEYGRRHILIAGELLKKGEK